MKQLGQFGDEIQAAGQNTGLQEIERLQTLYEELRTQVAAQSTKLSYAVEVREQYHNTRGDLETCVRDCQDHLEAVSLPGVSIPAKLDKYKVIFFVILCTIFKKEKLNTNKVSICDYFLWSNLRMHKELYNEWMKCVNIF